MPRRSSLARLSLGHRLATGLVALWAGLGVQLAALPPDVFSHVHGECVMACSVEDRECCCKMLFGERGHRRAAASGPRIAAPERVCPEVSAVVDKARDGGKLLRVAARAERSSPDGGEQTVAGSPPVRRFGLADPSTLPRPPPAFRPAC